MTLQDAMAVAVYREIMAGEVRFPDEVRAAALNFVYAQKDGYVLMQERNLDCAEWRAFKTALSALPEICTDPYEEES
jgi:hypothetical protein